MAAIDPTLRVLGGATLADMTLPSLRSVPPEPG